MMAAEAIAPTSTWPSAPTFQNRMRKAGSTAKPTHNRMAASRNVTHMRRLVPTAPSQMPA